MVAKIMVRNRDWGGKVEWIERISPKDAIMAAIALLDSYESGVGRLEPTRLFLNWKPDATNHADWAEDVEGREGLIELLREHGGFVALSKPPKESAYPTWGEF